MINKLVEKIQQTGAPIVVGLDPMMKFIPEQITKAAFAECGETQKVQRKRYGSIIKESWMLFMIWYRQ